MADPFFFGYGSLVNSGTHGFTQFQQAHAKGWRRAWRHTSLRQVSFLTAIPDAHCGIDGAIAAVPNADWEALDQREHAYERIAASHQVSHNAGSALDIALYAIAADRHGPPSDDHPILMSYLETVLQGYLQLFGPDGVSGFLETTDGWEAPILDDRATPIYPRASAITTQEREMFVDLLGDLGVRVMKGSL